MPPKLSDRIHSYQNVFDYKILPKLPIIIEINGRSSNKTTSLLEKPFCENFSQCMMASAYRICTEIDGAVFGYLHGDDLTIIMRNDQNLETTPWYDNKIQNICSSTASMFTYYFNNYSSATDLNTMGDSIFLSKVYAVPTLTEAINVLIFKQQENFYNSIHWACFYELLNKKYDKTHIKEMLSGLSIDQKIELLKEQCNIDFNNYPLSFRRGIGFYKKPQMTDGGLKNKWTINQELTIFTKDHDFLTNLI